MFPGMIFKVEQKNARKFCRKSGAIENGSFLNMDRILGMELAAPPLPQISLSLFKFH